MYLFLLCGDHPSLEIASTSPTGWQRGLLREKCVRVSAEKLLYPQGIGGRLGSQKIVPKLLESIWLYE